MQSPSHTHTHTTQLTPVFACHTVEAPLAKQLSVTRRCALLCVTASGRQRERRLLSARNAEWRRWKSTTLVKHPEKKSSARTALRSQAFYMLAKPVFSLVSPFLLFLFKTLEPYLRCRQYRCVETSSSGELQELSCLVTLALTKSLKTSVNCQYRL